MREEQTIEGTFHNTPVLVTGGCGFIGSHLVERLAAAGAAVTVVDNFQSGARTNLAHISQTVDVVEGDVRQFTAMEALVLRCTPAYVFHLAANASVPNSVQDPAYDFEANASGTFALLNAVRLVGSCRKVVSASSGAVYGEPVTFPIAETDALAPISPYGASKLCSEVTARIMHTVYGVPVTISRIFNTYGPRMARFVILDFLKKLDRDSSRLEILGTGRQVRDFTYVTDTVEGLMLLALHGTPAEAYNVSSGTSSTVTGLAHELIAARNYMHETELCFTGQSWQGDAQRWEVSIAKLQALGYRARVNLREGIERTMAWYDGRIRAGAAAGG